MNKKTLYEIPRIEIIELNSVDIITTSSKENEWTDENVQEEGWISY